MSTSIASLKLFKEGLQTAPSNREQLSTSNLTVTFITLVSHAKSREAELRWVIEKNTLQDADHSPTCLDTAPKETLREFASGPKQMRRLQGF